MRVRPCLLDTCREARTLLPESEQRIEERRVVRNLREECERRRGRGRGDGLRVREQAARGQLAVHGEERKLGRGGEDGAWQRPARMFRVERIRVKR